MFRRSGRGYIPDFVACCCSKNQLKRWHRSVITDFSHKGHQNSITKNLYIIFKLYFRLVIALCSQIELTKHSFKRILRNANIELNTYVEVPWVIQTLKHTQKYLYVSCVRYTHIEANPHVNADEYLYCVIQTLKQTHM